MSLERRYRRLLRWYPRTWREAHGEVLLGTALDAAEAEGRTRPGTAEAWTLRMSGAGLRLDARGALVLSVAGLALALLGAFSLFALNHGSPLLTVSSAALAPILLTFAVCALLRHLGALPPVAALLVSLIASGAWVLSALSQWSWSLGFDEADADVTRSPFSLAFPWLFLAAWVVGAVATGIAGLAIGSALPRGARIVLALLGAVFLPPTLGLGTVTPFSSAVVAVVLAALAATRLERSRDPRPILPRAKAPVRLRRVVGVTAIGSGMLCAAGVVFALAGSLWATGVDSTRAMQIGIALGDLALLPLALALGASLGARVPRDRALLWAGTALFAAGLAGAAVPSLLGDTRSAEPNWLASAIGGVGLGLIVYALLHLGTPSRILLAVACATTYAVLLGWMLPLILPFLGPLLATALAVWGLRRPRRSAAPPPALAPQPAQG